MPSESNAKEVIRITEHSRDLAVLQKDGLDEPWGDVSKPAILDFLNRKKSNIGRLEYAGNRLSVHFFRCAGANSLYQKLLRKCAEHRFPKAAVATQTSMSALLHDMFKCRYNDCNSTTKLKPSEFHNYYMQCESDCVRTFGISPMDEDEDEFDHGFPKVN